MKKKDDGTLPRVDAMGDSQDSPIALQNEVTPSPASERVTHTPGPWTVKVGADPRDFIVAEPSGNTVCEPNAELFNDWPELDESIRYISVDEAMANARLIAAAPELLAACVEFVRKCECGEARSARSYRQMKDAIARAEGREATHDAQ